ncbi:hypothetical protein [Rhizobium hidalgonense]|uniref:hypothetical protein n=1 Tax=Rhizobium hidalgonense TaxID=1538159 RepID=UPI00287194A8|nr:hypothetical protein [Rhizobium hidalgonense]MDR9813062.1 hypothetical protein [Rhizobium hidalgonense]
MNIVISNWGWPQYIYVALMLLALIGNITMDGKPRQPHNGYVGLSNFLLSFILLTAGGFFG